MTPQQDNWKERFIKSFTVPDELGRPSLIRILARDYSATDDITESDDTRLAREIESFISQERQAVAREIVEMLEEMNNGFDEDRPHILIGYDLAIQASQRLIRERWGLENPAEQTKSV